jgi:hypothetical protein
VALVDGSAEFGIDVEAVADAKVEVLDYFDVKTGDLRHGLARRNKAAQFTRQRALIAHVRTTGGSPKREKRLSIDDRHIGRTARVLHPTTEVVSTAPVGRGGGPRR